MYVSLILKSIFRFRENNGPTNAAAMAYYTALALPSLLIVSISIVGFFIEPQQVQGELGRQIERVAGEQTAEQVQEIVIAANRPKESVIASVIGIVMLLVGATGVLAQLQSTLNRFWGVEVEESTSRWLQIMFKRFLSLGMLLVIAFMLLVAVTVQAAITEFGQAVDSILPAPWSSGLVASIDGIATFLILLVLLAAMFRFLPDVRIPWRCVWFGAAITSVLFTIGQLAMTVYLKYSQPGDVYGTAGALAVILIWVYYASMILLFGSQLTRVWADFRGIQVVAEDHAVSETDSR